MHVRRMLLVAFSLLVLAACGSHDRQVGERCQSDGDCESELCVMGGFGGARCEDPCGGNDANCEPGYVCTGRAEGYVAFCESVVTDEGPTIEIE